MRAEELRELLLRGESETVEFKRGFHREAIETLAAFANARGGVLVVGVSDRGRPLGVRADEDTLREWAQRIARATRPSLRPRLERVELAGRRVVVLEVEPSRQGPVGVAGRYLQRRGTQNLPLEPEAMARLALEATLPWDTGLVGGEEPLDPELAGQLPLEEVGLVRGGRITWAALLLLGRRPQRLFPHAHLRIGRFAKGRLREEQVLEGPLLAQLRRALGELAPLHPALGEALTNAVAHRDYRIPGSVQVRLEEDRVEVWSPGGLPAGLSPGALLAPHPSLPPNPLLARALERLGHMRGWGTGTLEMAERCRAAGLPPPEYRLEGGVLRLILRR